MAGRPSKLLRHKDGLGTFVASILQCSTKITCDLQWLTVRSLQTLGRRLELAQRQGCPQVFGNHSHLSSCVHFEWHFLAIDANGAIPRGSLVCPNGVEIDHVIVVCCIRLHGYISNRLVEALCTIVLFLLAGMAFGVMGWTLLT